MTLAEFRNVLCILKNIDRYELEAVGLIDVPKGQEVFPGCLDKPDAIWRLFRDDPYYWLLRADDDRAAKVWSIVEARLLKEKTMTENALLRPLAAIAKGGAGDINLLAARAANEIKRLEAELDRLRATEARLRAALLATRKLVSEAAMTGFNCKDGDWAKPKIEITPEMLKAGAREVLACRIGEIDTPESAAWSIFMAMAAELGTPVPATVP